MEKINYKDIEKDKNDLLFLISKMRVLYAQENLHTYVLECDQWITMLNMKEIKTSYTPEALIVLRRILNDTANYFLLIGNYSIGEGAINLMNKVASLFKKENNE